MAVIDLSCNPKEWDQYVSTHERGTVFHYWGWTQSLSQTYDVSPWFLAARNVPGGKICGVLPLICFNPPQGQARLISLPYTDAAGLISDHSQITIQLLSTALQLADDLGAPHLEIRQTADLELSALRQEMDRLHVYHQDFNFKVSLKRRLPDTLDSLWQGIGAKVRNQVRKAQKKEYRTEVGGIDMLDAFYSVFSHNMRDLGSPVHTKRLFQTLAGHLSSQISIIVIKKQTLPVAASLVLRHHQTLANPWASSLRQYRPDCPNMLLYWAMLSHAVNHQCLWFDFGRSSPHAPTCRFKEQWGAEKSPLLWHVFSKTGTRWTPDMEHLEFEEIKTQSLEQACRLGPEKRRWISL